MIQSLAIVRTGLEGAQTNMDIIANNLANVDTAGFKTIRPIFQDLLYQNATQPGGFTSQDTNYPSGLQTGTGANVIATEPIITQGGLQQTGNALDLAINGNGYFQVLTPSGTVAYTRDGSFELNAEGQVVTANGYPIQPPITVPAGAQSITIGTDGTVSVQLQGQANPTQIGLIELASFINPAGLQSVGNDLALQTQSSGAATPGKGGTVGLGSIEQGYLESSNVSVVNEMVDMIECERDYELNTQAAQSVNSMLGYLNNVTSS